MAECMCHRIGLVNIEQSGTECGVEFLSVGREVAVFADSYDAHQRPQTLLGRQRISIRSERET